jgi:ABC-type glycerol-3-phosphate transport system substrate-binding protein
MDENNPSFPNNDPPSPLGEGQKRQNQGVSQPEARVSKESKQSTDFVAQDSRGEQHVDKAQKQAEAYGKEGVKQPMQQHSSGTGATLNFAQNTSHQDVKGQTMQPNQAIQEQQPTPPQKKFKKKFPIKIILTLFLVLIVLSVIGVFLLRFLKTGISDVGTKGQIEWWGVTYDEAVLKPVIDEFESANAGVSINYIKQSPTDYRERLTNEIARGEGPDIFEIHNSWVPMFRNDLDTIPNNIVSSAEYAQRFYPVAVSDFTTKKGIVAIPLYYDAITLYINEDVFATAGVSPPVDWNDFREVAKQLSQPNEKGELLLGGAAIGTTSNVDYWPEIVGLMLQQNKFDPTNPRGPKVEDALVFYKIFSSLHKVWDETLPPSTQAFANGKVAMFFAPASAADEINKINPDLRFRTINLPELPLNDPEEPDVSYATYWANGVWNRSVNRQKSWELLDFMTKQESLTKIASNMKQTSNFSYAYPRRDMGVLLKDDPILGSIVSLAPNARSWYLAYETNDGESGINSRINKVFMTALEDISQGRAATKVVDALAQEAREVLAGYGLIKIQPSPAN